MRHRRLSDPDALAAVRAWRPGLALLVGADIAPEALLTIPRVGTLNAHYGLLPGYRGMNVTEWAIYQDDPLGVTVHWVDRGIDTGAIAAREQITVQPGATLESLRRHQEAAARPGRGGPAVAERSMPSTPRRRGRASVLPHASPAPNAVEAKLRTGTYRCRASD